MHLNLRHEPPPNNFPYYMPAVDRPINTVVEDVPEDDAYVPDDAGSDCESSDGITDEELDGDGEVNDDEDDGDDDDNTHAAPSPPSLDLPDLPDLAAPEKKSRYSTARQTTPRYALGPPNRPFQYQRMGRTVASVYREYKLGTHGNPPIEALEARYGTGWRSGTLKDIKYGSNYVAVRRMMVRKVEEMCEGGVGWEEACGRLDERVDGRLQLLIQAVRRGQDPFEVIPVRK